MNPIRIPERFACGLKLDFGESVALRRDLARPFGGDAPIAVGVRPEILSSIDQMFQVGTSSLDFCRLALLHADADADLISNLDAVRARLSERDFPATALVRFEAGPAAVRVTA